MMAFALEHVGACRGWVVLCVCTASLGCGDDDNEPTATADEPAVTSAATDAEATTEATGAATTGDDDTGPSDPSGGDGDTASSDIDPLEGRWVERAPLAGGPRQEVGVVTAGGRMWVLGGLVGAEVLARVEAYDPVNDTWEEQADLPIAMHHPNAAAVGERIVVAGFLRGTEFAADGTVFVFDPQVGGWQLGSAMPPGTERGAAATATLGGLVYVIGGRREGRAVSDAQTYDVEAGVWSSIAELPAARDHMIIGVIDGRLYVVGGRDGSIAAHTDRVDVYDPAADAWSLAAPMPTSRGGMAAGVIEGLLFVAGGEGNPGTASGVFDEVEVYDPVADAWLTLDPMPNPRHGTAGAVLDGVFFVPGGADVEGGGAVEIHEAWLPHER
jgi:N-acetylneuraminic acid mutarotase